MDTELNDNNASTQREGSALTDLKPVEYCESESLQNNNASDYVTSEYANSNCDGLLLENSLMELQPHFQTFELSLSPAPILSSVIGEVLSPNQVSTMVSNNTSSVNEIIQIQHNGAQEQSQVIQILSSAQIPEDNLEALTNFIKTSMRRDEVVRVAICGAVTQTFDITDTPSTISDQSVYTVQLIETIDSSLNDPEPCVLEAFDEHLIETDYHENLDLPVQLDTQQLTDVVSDYISEQEQNGDSDSEPKYKRKKNNPLVSRFMEDHLELQSGNKSVFESSFDSSIVVGAKKLVRYNVCGATISRANDPPENECNEVLNESEGESVAVDILYRTAHKCAYCEFSSRSTTILTEHCKTYHAGLEFLVLKPLPTCKGNVCPFCKHYFEYSDYMVHMSSAHSDEFPLKCFYCEFTARDKNQIKHHKNKKHGITVPLKIINLFKPRLVKPHSQEDVAVKDEYDYSTDEEQEFVEQLSASVECPECNKKFKTPKGFKFHVKVHFPHRYKCGYCAFFAPSENPVLKHIVRVHKKMPVRVSSHQFDPNKHPIISKNIDALTKFVNSFKARTDKEDRPDGWMRKWTCPHCDYVSQHGSSYRRHLRMHNNCLPYKCSYCSFKGREKYYIRRHIDRIHKDLPVVIVTNSEENRQYDDSSDEDNQQKGLRRRRKRKLKANSRIYSARKTLETELEAQAVAKRAPVKTVLLRQTTPSDQNTNNIPTAKQDRLLVFQGNYKRPSDFMLDRGRDAGKILCKICRAKLHTRAFYKHIRRHFKTKPFRCSYCQYTAIERSHVRVHIALKHTGRPFNIDVCNAKSLLPENLLELLVQGEVYRNDMLSKTKSPKVIFYANFTCPLCDTSVPYCEETIKVHFSDHFSYMPYSCGECQLQDSSVDALEAHIMEKHKNLMEVEIMSNSEPKPAGLDSVIDQYMNELERKRSEFEQQQKDAETKRKFELFQALNFTKDQAEKKLLALYSQNAENSPKKDVFKCPICDKKTNKHRATMKRHMYSHFEHKPFKCGQCDFTGITKNEVKQHTPKHGSSVPPSVVDTGVKLPLELDVLIETIVNDSFSLEPKYQMETEDGVNWKRQVLLGICPFCDDIDTTFTNGFVTHLRGHFHVYICPVCEITGYINDITEHLVTDHANETGFTEMDGIENPTKFAEDYCQNKNANINKNGGEETVLKFEQCLGDVNKLMDLLPKKGTDEPDRNPWKECLFCRKKFRRLHELQQHIHDFHGNQMYYQCGYCTYHSASTKDVRKHLIVVHGDKQSIIREIMGSDNLQTTADNDQEAMAVQSFYHEDQEIQVFTVLNENSLPSGAVPVAVIEAEQFDSFGNAIHSDCVNISDIQLKTFQQLSNNAFD